MDRRILRSSLSSGAVIAGNRVRTGDLSTISSNRGVSLSTEKAPERVPSGCGAAI